MTEPGAPILVLGGSGMLGQALRRTAPQRITGTYATQPFPGGHRFLAEVDHVDHLLDTLDAPPAAAILMFGQTSIDACFRDPVAAARLNVDATLRAAHALNARGIATVLVSTDAVFDGSRGGWRDDDTPHPLHEYGRQKLAAEHGILQHADSLVIRLPKLIVGDLHPHCFVSAWSRALWTGQPISCATDQRFNPLGTADAAAAIIALIDRGSRGRVHVASASAVRRWDLLHHLIARLGDALAAPPRVTPCTLADLGLSEPRPVDSSLAPSAVLAALPLRMRAPLELIEQVAPRLLSALREGH